LTSISSRPPPNCSFSFLVFGFQLATPPNQKPEPETTIQKPQTVAGRLAGMPCVSSSHGHPERTPEGCKRWAETQTGPAHPQRAAGNFPPPPRWRLATRRLLPSRFACQRTAGSSPEALHLPRVLPMSSLICRGLPSRTHGTWRRTSVFSIPCAARPYPTRPAPPV